MAIILFCVERIPDSFEYHMPLGWSMLLASMKDRFPYYKAKSLLKTICRWSTRTHTVSHTCPELWTWLLLLHLHDNSLLEGLQRLLFLKITALTSGLVWMTHFSLQFLLNLWCNPGTRMGSMAKQWFSIALQRVILCLQLCGSSQKVWSYLNCLSHSKYMVCCQQYLSFQRRFLQTEMFLSPPPIHLMYTTVNP